MAAQLESGKSLSREIKLHGVEEPVIVTIDSSGVTLRVKGTKKSISGMWCILIPQMVMPKDVKSFLANDPMKFLQHQALQVVKSRERKLEQ